MEIKIMSYNTQHCLNYVTREIDFDMVADTIKQYGADIVGLQEIRDAGEREDYEAQAKIVAEKLGFYYYFAKAFYFADKGPYGNAVLSRYPIVEAQTIPIPNPVEYKYGGYYEPRCLLKAKIDAAGGLNVLVSHFGLNPDEAENAVKTVVANLPEENCVLMGDFNVTPENPVLLPIREKLADTAEHFDAPKLSFPSYAPTGKIDYIFVSKDMKVQFADIPQIVTSDHCPHLATIEK